MFLMRLFPKSLARSHVVLAEKNVSKDQIKLLDCIFSIFLFFIYWFFFVSKTASTDYAVCPSAEHLSLFRVLNFEKTIKCKEYMYSSYVYSFLC